ATRTELVSVNSEGGIGNSNSYDPAISRDGRYVVFASSSSNLVLNDTNGHQDIFLRDRTAGTTIRVSVSSSTQEANGDSSNPAVSDNGRYVVFSSDADNLIAGDTNGRMDVFVRDTLDGITTRVSVKTGGGEGNEHSGAYGAALSADGRYIAFDSKAENLVNGDTNGYRDIFLHDRSTATTTRINLRFISNEQAESGDSIDPAISADGRYVAFQSYADDLVPCDDNHQADILIRDRITGITSRASVGTYACGSNGTSSHPSISDDGRYVVFDSDADNLLAWTGKEDTNGKRDVFIHDTQSVTTERVSISSSGAEGNDRSGGYGAGLSSDGRYVTFNSFATNLVPDDYNKTYDIFVRDRTAGKTTLESRGHYWEQGTMASERASMSSDGRYVAFSSDSDNLVAGDSNGRRDIFVRDYLWPGPLVKTIDPPSGLIDGGTTVTLTGGNFNTATKVFFDGLQASNVNVINSGKMTCVSPAHPVGTISLTAVNADGTSWNYFYGYLYRTNAMPWLMFIVGK
ncbi:MAG TPA: hypothetical protein ENK89_04300, partial [Desulfobulbaceae bacterium]|nr:hypothetical protein [Desulfobulbaceae bacterium]